MKLLTHSHTKTHKHTQIHTDSPTGTQARGHTRMHTDTSTLSAHTVIHICIYMQTTHVHTSHRYTHTHTLMYTSTQTQHRHSHRRTRVCTRASLFLPFRVLSPPSPTVETLGHFGFAHLPASGAGLTSGPSLAVQQT